MKQIFDIEVYEDENGNAPFADWLVKLKDKCAKVKIQTRIDRASLGNFGDFKSLKGTKNVYEMREHYGSGFRIFYTKVGRKIVLLLAGSTKKDQDKAISKAKEYLTDYKRRQNDD